MNWNSLKNQIFEKWNKSQNIELFRLVNFLKLALNVPMSCKFLFMLEKISRFFSYKITQNFLKYFWLSQFVLIFIKKSSQNHFNNFFQPFLICLYDEIFLKSTVTRTKIYKALEDTVLINLCAAVISFYWVGTWILGLLWVCLFHSNIVKDF